MTVLTVRLSAAGLSCPAGMPLGAFELNVQRGDASAPIPLNRINQLEEGDRILYSPLPGRNEKRPGEVSIVLIAAGAVKEGEENFSVLEPRPADKPAKWQVSSRSALALYVYGPSGLSTRKLKGFLAKDQELIVQLADYAEKTSQTESVLQALTQYESTGYGEGLGAALQGLAGQYGNANKIDRTAPLDQQTLAALRTLNPALSAYDPISPSSSQKVAQTTGLAATVAGMFLGSTVGLAAGSTAMALNLKTLMFPDTDFRSAYAQSSEARPGLTLCSARDANQGRKRHAFLWALRIPDAGPPRIALDSASHIPQGLRTPVRIQVPEPQRRLVSRIREWSLVSGDGKRVPLPVIAAVDGQQLELNLTNTSVAPGKYALKGMWDWDALSTEGEIEVHRLGSFGGARLTPESALRLLPRSGKQVVTLEGTDFQFVERASLVRQGDKYAAPVPVPFSLPLGLRRGVQTRLEMQIDTTNLDAGVHLLALTQQGGSVQNVEIRILEQPPKIQSLPLTVNCGEGEDLISLNGEGLDRITSLEASGIQFALEAPDASGKHRTARVRSVGDWKPGGTTDLRVSVRDYPASLVLSNALLLAGPKPKIREVEPSVPSQLPIELRKGELLSGVVTNLLLRVDGADAGTSLALECRDAPGQGLTIRPGTDEDRVRLQPVQSGTMFLSLDPGRWPGGCVLMATLETKESGRSRPFELGKVVRMPAIEAFRLTDEAAGEGMYYAILTGRDLELIEKTGWDAQNGQPVQGLPSAILGEPNKQSLKVRMPWPSPAPHSPLYVWFRGETSGRATTARY